MSDGNDPTYTASFQGVGNVMVSQSRAKENKGLFSGYFSKCVFESIRY